MPYIDKSKCKVKLWVGMPNGEDNQVWYNYLSENNQSTDYIIKKMTHRILEQRLGGYYNKAVFYENGKIYKQIKPL